MKSSKYLYELDVIINCLAGTPEEEDVILKKRNMQKLKQRLRLYRDTPSAKEKVLETYNRLRADAYKKHAKDPLEKRGELLDERAVTVAAQFLSRWADSEGEGKKEGPGTVPGFPGNGAKARRQMQRDLSKGHTGKRKVPVVHPE